MPDPIPLPQRYGIADAIDDYLAECRARGLRARTVANSYGLPLRRLWLPWCQEHGILELMDVTQQVVNRWTASLHDRRRSDGEAISPHTVRTYGVTISRWLAWATREGLLKSSMRVPRNPVSRPVREVLTEDEVRRLLEQAGNLRDRLIVEVLWETGLRAAELLNLRTGDVVRHDGRWFLRVLAPYRGGGAKGGRERLVPVPHSRELRRFLEGPRAQLDATTDHVFCSRRRGSRGRYEPLQVSGLEQVLDGLAAEARIGRKIGPHLFRHSAATHWLRQGMDPMRVAAVLGHTSLAMLERHYSQLDHRDAYDALAAVLVRERG